MPTNLNSKFLVSRISTGRRNACKCYFRVFQLELDALDTKNFEIGSVDTTLQSYEVGDFREKRQKCQYFRSFGDLTWFQTVIRYPSQVTVLRLRWLAFLSFEHQDVPESF